MRRERERERERRGELSLFAGVVGPYKRRPRSLKLIGAKERGESRVGVLV